MDLLCKGLYWLFFVCFRKSWYLPAPAVSPKAPLEFKLVSKHVSEWGTVKLSFEARGKMCPGCEEGCGGVSHKGFSRLVLKTKEH